MDFVSLCQQKHLPVYVLPYFTHCMKVAFRHKGVGNDEACIGVIRIQDICHFTFRDIGYYPLYSQGYGILGSIFVLLPRILKI